MESLLHSLVSDPDRTNALAAVANVIVAAVALLVAALSIFFSWKSLASQTKHNKLSVKPLPFIAVADYEDRLLVKLVNNGSGPLIVKSTTVHGSGQHTESLIGQMPRMPPSLAWKTFTSGMRDRSILPGDELFFVDLVGNPSDPIFRNFRDDCRRAMASLTVTITYSDIYSDKFDPISRKLNWFARNMVPNKKS
jgi:hypothetical protein